MKHCFLLLLCALLLSGCYAHDTIVQLNDDGSGTIEVHVGVNQAYQQQQEAAGQVPIDPQTLYEIFSAEVDNFPEAWQPALDYWSDSTYAGVRLTTQFTDTAMLQSQLNTLREKASNYNSMITTLTATRQNDHVSVVAALTGRPFDANGDALPAGYPSRFHWEVQSASVVECTPSRFSSCNSTSALWEFGIDALGNGESLTLTSDSQMGTTPTPTTPRTITPTPDGNATATPTITLTPQPGGVIVATSTPTATPTPTDTLAITATATAAVDVAPTGFGATPGPGDIRATEQPTEVVILPRGTSPAQPGRLPTAVAPLATAAPAGATTVAQLPPAPAPDTTGPSVRYLPLVARDASVGAAGESPTRGGTVVQSLRLKRPVLPYRNLMIGLFLLASFVCFAYVLLRRIQMQRRARAAAAAQAAAPAGEIPPPSSEQAPPPPDDQRPEPSEGDRQL
ncbi:hypothetical protein F8S13_19765 [Chloroflexia bacterium SDU3-3]|nr:hypothetical protein F8S13_19765 [Chloroflexia bacterium SDU3-3]